MIITDLLCTHIKMVFVGEELVRLNLNGWKSQYLLVARRGLQTGPVHLQTDYDRKLGSRKTAALVSRAVRKMYERLAIDNGEYYILLKKNISPGSVQSQSCCTGPIRDTNKSTVAATGVEKIKKKNA